MSPSTGHRGTAAALAGVALLGALALAGCAAGHAVKTISHPVAGHHPGASRHPVANAAVPGGKRALGAFIAKLQAGAATPFEAKYEGFGKRDGMVVYAVRPPDGLLFEVTPLGLAVRRTQLVANGSGEYLCTSRGHAPWTCRQLGAASAAAQNRQFDVYTAAHWAAYLKTVALAAGAKVTTFTPPPYMTTAVIGRGTPVKGMKCLDFRPAGIIGTDTICAPAPGVLGSVFGCTRTTIMMRSYSTSPSASLFQLPPGAKVIGLKAGNTARAA